MPKKVKVQKESVSKVRRNVFVTFKGGEMQPTDSKTMKLYFLKKLLKDGYIKLEDIEDITENGESIKKEFYHKRGCEHSYVMVWNNGNKAVYECEYCQKVELRNVESGN